MGIAEGLTRKMHFAKKQLKMLSSCLRRLQSLPAIYAVRQLSTFLLLLFTSFLNQQYSHADTNVTVNQLELEYRIKAAYLFNLSKFIEWPDESINSQASIDICLIGGNPFGDYIYKLEQRNARGRPINIIDAPATDTLSSCEMIFFKGNVQQPDNFLGNLQSSKSLTVGESDVFINQGGLINLAIENGRVQLTINNVMAKKMGFTISANLLEIARLVE